MEEPHKRPDFSNLVVTISLILEAVAGCMEFSLSKMNIHLPLKQKSRPGKVVLMYGHQARRRPLGNMNRRQLCS